LKNRKYWTDERILLSSVLFYAHKQDNYVSEADNMQKGVNTMKHDDEMVLKDIQKNTQMGMTAIDTILDKIGNDEFSITLSRQSLHYADIHNRALNRILQQEGEGYRGSQISEMMLKGSIHANTAFNISTEHLAEMMIQGSNRGITSMWKSLKHNGLAEKETVELAKELMDFEEKSIEALKEYL